LTQETFDYFVTEYGGNFREINFFKCPLVGDLSALETLSDIQKLTYFWNQRAENLWDLSKNRSLREFSFDDFTRMHHLRQVARSRSLVELNFGDKVWVTYVLETLGPLTGMKQLEKVTFSAKKIEDGRIGPLAELPALRELDFPLNQFPTEKVAWLKARLPEGVKGRGLAPYWRCDRPIEMRGKQIDTYIIGKRKPALDWSADRARIEKYTKKFEDLVTYYRANPNEDEPD